MCELSKTAGQSSFFNQYMLQCEREGVGITEKPKAVMLMLDLSKKNKVVIALRLNFPTTSNILIPFICVFFKNFLFVVVKIHFIYLGYAKLKSPLMQMLSLSH